MPNHTNEFGRKAWRHSNHNSSPDACKQLCKEFHTMSTALHQSSFCEASLSKDFRGHKHIPQSPSRQCLLPWQQWPFPQSRSASPPRSMNSKQGKLLQEALAIRSLHLHCFESKTKKSWMYFWIRPKCSVHWHLSVKSSKGRNNEIHKAEHGCESIWGQCKQVSYYFNRSVCLSHKTKMNQFG